MITSDMLKNLRGYIVNNYTVIRPAPRTGGKPYSRWRCQCKCGAWSILYSHELIDRRTPPCPVCGLRE